MSGPHRLTVGVLGGLGPEATLDLFAKVLAHTPAERDQDHLHLIIDNDPSVPNRNEAVAGTGPSPGPQLAAMARRLEAAGADFLVMPCNAAHAFQDAIEGAVRIPFVSIVEEAVADACARAPDGVRVGVLAAAGALDAGLYQQAFARRGIDVLVPTGAAREAFMTLLYRIKGGDKGEPVRRGMRALADSMAAQGAAAVVAGCTEVPLVLGQDDLALPLVDATDALARAAVALATGLRALPLRPPAAP